MLDRNYFLNILKKQVEQSGDQVIVTLVLHAGSVYYVRDVVSTYPGYVVLNVWHGKNGQPIKAPSSDAFSDEVPKGFHSITITYESINFIEVNSTSEYYHQRIGFKKFI